MGDTIPKAFFAYPSSQPTLKESIHGAIPELNNKGRVNIKTWEECNTGGKFVINTICNAIDEAQLFFADLTGLNPNVMFELGYAIARDKRIWLILDDTYTEQNKMFKQLKILTTVAYVPCCNSQDIVSGFYENNPVEDMENTIFRTAIEPILTPGGYDSILYLKSQHEIEAAMHMSNLLGKRFPKKIIVDASNKPAVQSLADYGDLVFGCNGLICHFTNPEREGAHVQNVQQALICGMAHGFEKPLLMLAEGEFLSPIDYRDFLKHYDTAPQALGYLKEWLPRVEQGLKADGDRFAGIRDPLSEPHVEQGLKANQEAYVAPRKIFITYAHQDTEAQKKLKTYLALMEKEGKIAFWDDNKIPPGNEWFKNISSNLANSDILLYLISPRSLASDNCNKELAIALHAEIRIIPILLESCDWQNHQLSAFQALPDKGKPINKWQPESDGWQNVVNGIHKVIGEMQSQVDSLSRTSKKEQHAESVFQQDNALMMVERVEQAVERDSYTVTLDPNNADAYFNRGNVYHSKGDYDRAIEAFDGAIELKPDYAGAYTNRGIAYQNKGDYARAIGDHTKAIELNPDYADAYFNLGNTYHRKGDYDHAIEAFTKAIAIRGDFAAAYTNRGIAHQNKGNFDLAFKDHAKAIDLNPDYAEAYFNRGDAYRNKGDVYYDTDDYDSAIADYTKAIELNPDFVGAYNHRDAAYYAKGDFASVIMAYTKVIDLNSNDAIAYHYRGTAYGRKGDYDSAIADHTKAIAIKPDFAEAYNNRGVAYDQSGDYDSAIADFNKAIELKPASVSAYFNRGMTWLHSGKWEEAKSDLIVAKNKGLNLIQVFHYAYTGVEDFERKNGFKLPEDIAAMVTVQR